MVQGFLIATLYLEKTSPSSFTWEKKKRLPTKIWTRCVESHLMCVGSIFIVWANSHTKDDSMHIRGCICVFLSSITLVWRTRYNYQPKCKESVLNDLVIMLAHINFLIFLEIPYWKCKHIACLVVWFSLSFFPNQMMKGKLFSYVPIAIPRGFTYSLAFRARSGSLGSYSERLN